MLAFSFRLDSSPLVVLFFINSYQASISAVASSLLLRLQHLHIRISVTKLWYCWTCTAQQMLPN